MINYLNKSVDQDLGSEKKEVILTFWKVIHLIDTYIETNLSDNFDKIQAIKIDVRYDKELQEVVVKQLSVDVYLKDSKNDVNFLAHELSHCISKFLQLHPYIPTVEELVS